MQEFKIDCDFKRIVGYKYTENSSEVAFLRKECAIAKEFGLKAEWVSPDSQFNAAGGYRIENTARFHPLAYTRGLARYLTSRISTNVAIYEHTRASRPTNTTVSVKVVAFFAMNSQNRIQLVVSIKFWRRKWLWPHTHHTLGLSH